jgi:CRP-like cAMP-binding protein
MSDPNRLPPFPDQAPAPRRSKLAKKAQVEHLAALPLFAQCTTKELRHLAASTRVDLLEADQPLFSEGLPSHEAYVIVAGRAAVRRAGRQITELGPGDVVGELGLLLQRPHSATVVAVTPVEVLALPQAALRQAVEELPGLGWKLLQTVATRMAADAEADAGTVA